MAQAHGSLSAAMALRLRRPCAVGTMRCGSSPFHVHSSMAACVLLSWWSLRDARCVRGVAARFSIYLSIYLSIHLSIHLSIYPSTIFAWVPLLYTSNGGRLGRARVATV